jgi:hypothetical protein
MEAGGETFLLARVLVPLGPEKEPIACVGELHAHPDAVAGPADATLDH